MRSAADPSLGPSPVCRSGSSTLENHFWMDLDVCVTVRSFTKLYTVKTLLYCSAHISPNVEGVSSKTWKTNPKLKAHKIMSTYFRPYRWYEGNGTDRLVILGSEVDFYIYIIVHYIYLMVCVAFWFYICHTLPLDVTPEHQYLRQKQTNW